MYPQRSLSYFLEKSCVRVLYHNKRFWNIMNPFWLALVSFLKLENWIHLWKLPHKVADVVQLQGLLLLMPQSEIIFYEKFPTMTSLQLNFLQWTSVEKSLVTWWGTSIGRDFRQMALTGPPKVLHRLIQLCIVLTFI